MERHSYRRGLARNLHELGSPEQGMLITPYPTFWITLPFALFFGSMWSVFVYVAFLLGRVHKIGVVNGSAG